MFSGTAVAVGATVGVGCSNVAAGALVGVGGGALHAARNNASNAKLKRKSEMLLSFPIICALNRRAGVWRHSFLCSYLEELYIVKIGFHSIFLHKINTCINPSHCSRS